MEISRMEDEVRKSDEEITRTIKVKGEAVPQALGYIFSSGRS